MARIRNRLTGQEDLFGTVAEAEAALEKWKRKFRKQGLVVSDNEDGSCSVSEPGGRPVGIYEVE